MYDSARLVITQVGDKVKFIFDPAIYFFTANGAALWDGQS